MSAGFSDRQSVADEQAFLPAATEVLETPASPLKHGLTLCICLLFTLLVLLGWLGTIDIVVEAEGRIIPDTHTKPISPIQMARVQTLFIKEGSHVKAGDELVELVPNPSDLESVSSQPAEEITTQQLNILRLDTLLQQIKPDSETIELQNAINLEQVADSRNIWFPVVPDQGRWELENSTLDSEIHSWRVTDETLLKKIEEYEAILSAYTTELHKFTLLRPIHDEIANDTFTLFKKNMVSEVDWLTRREKQIDTQQQVRILEQRVLEQKARLSSAKVERKQKYQELLLRIHKERLHSTQTLAQATGNVGKGAGENTKPDASGTGFRHCATVVCSLERGCGLTSPTDYAHRSR